MKVCDIYNGSARKLNRAPRFDENLPERTPSYVALT